ncbi:MAG: coproporphyrinogen III oxidase, partial [Gammaproteobacteria bacterium]|nr:coproporphyrinogen III oxidase [Gammaproteobacteria bacterium]
MSKPDLQAIKTYLLNLQQSICDELTQEDGEQTFIADEWQREQGGGGKSCVLSNGAVFESA